MVLYQITLHCYTIATMGHAKKYGSWRTKKRQGFSGVPSWKKRLPQATDKARTPPAEWCRPAARPQKFSADGYRFVHLAHVFDELSKAFSCSHCQKSNFQLLEVNEKRRGFCSTLMLKCTLCKSCHLFTTSPSLENQKGGQIRNKIIFI